MSIDMIGPLHQQILLLSKEERLRLIQYIVDSIRFEEFEKTSSPPINPKQEAELERRSASIRNGTAEFLTWEEIKSSLKK